MKGVISNVLILLSITIGITVEKQPAKRSYVCPPNFVRLSHRCYFFSKQKATWQDAYFQCHSMHSSLAIIKSRNQDKLIKRTLTKRTLEPLERWLGGRFDWQRKQWKWAASGKPLSYKGFDRSVNQDDDKLQWSCIVIDPDFEYRWNARSCLEEKHFICHKKIQTITDNKLRKKLLQQYNTNKLNEIPIPDVPNEKMSPNNLKSRQRIQTRTSSPFEIDVSPLLEEYDKGKKISPKKKKNVHGFLRRPFSNDTLKDNGLPFVEINDQPYRRRRNKAKDSDGIQRKFHMYYKTYKEGGGRNPLHPSPIVEEYNFAKIS